jgi:activator of HSP90 ATPase
MVKRCKSATSRDPEETMSTTIHQEVVLAAGPERVYAALMDSKEHGEFTRDAADISSEAGGAFSAHGGKIVGRNIELVPNQRIVQAWRPASWGEGVFSIVRIELKREGSGTRLVLDHSGIPDGMRDHLDGGWQKMYWEPLRKHLGAG